MRTQPEGRAYLVAARVCEGPTCFRGTRLRRVAGVRVARRGWPGVRGLANDK